jgi:accessory secretory protein Asp2
MKQDLNVNNYKFIFSPLVERNISEKSRLVIYNNIEESFSHKIEIHSGESVEIQYTEFSPSYDFKYKYQVMINGSWVSDGGYKYLRQELLSKGNLKYLYYPQAKSDYLVVVFQAINENPGYNYVNTLAGIESNKLFIKDDYGTDELTRSSYYLGENKTHTITDNVINLIEEKRKEMGITKLNVICCGSSKGGYAAIYHAFKGLYGHAIAGGPQVLLGDYLLPKPENPRGFMADIFKYLTGDLQKQDIVWLNSQIFEQIDKSKNTCLHLHVGKGEPHYIEHAVPLLDYLGGDATVKLDLADYSTHTEMIKYFPTYIRKEILNIQGEV